MYWTAVVLASLVILRAVTGFAYSAESGDPIIPVVPLVAAGAIWLVGLLLQVADR